MKKQSIVLLVTLLFVASISVIILKNIDDSNKFVNSTIFDTTLTQLNISSKNVEYEIKKLLNSNSENIDEILEITSLGIPFLYHNIDILITINEYFRKSCNINKLKKISDLQNCGDAIFDNIEYPYDFLRVLKQYNPISNKDQLNYFIQRYVSETQDDKIEKIVNKFSILKLKDNRRYLNCKYRIKYNNINLKGTFIYDINSKSIVDKQYFL